jgi:hypothetical protein
VRGHAFRDQLVVLDDQDPGHCFTDSSCSTLLPG